MARSKKIKSIKRSKKIKSIKSIKSKKTKQKGIKRIKSKKGGANPDPRISGVIDKVEEATKKLDGVIDLINKLLEKRKVTKYLEPPPGFGVGYPYGATNTGSVAAGSSNTQRVTATPSARGTFRLSKIETNSPNLSQPSANSLGRPALVAAKAQNSESEQVENTSGSLAARGTLTVDEYLELPEGSEENPSANNWARTTRLAESNHN